MRDLLLWRLLRAGDLRAEVLAPLLEAFARLPLGQRFAHLGLIAPAATHPDPAVRAATARVLAGVEGLPGLRLLVTALGDPDPAVRLAAVEALRRSAEEQPARWVHEDAQAGVVEQKQQILVLVVEGNHGQDIFLHADEESVNAQLRTFLADEDQNVSDEQLHELLLGEEYGLIFRIDSYDDPRA